MHDKIEIKIVFIVLQIFCFDDNECCSGLSCNWFNDPSYSTIKHGLCYPEYESKKAGVSKNNFVYVRKVS